MLRKKLKTLATLSALLLGQPSFAYTQLGSISEDAVKVGCLFPMTGRGGLYGHDSQIGIQIALEHIAAYDRYPKLQVMIEDSRSKASRATRIAKDFVQVHGASFLCGVVNSSVALQVAQVAEEEKVFFIGTDHASSRLTTPLTNPYYFRLSNNTQQSMIAGAKYIKENLIPQIGNRPLRISYIAPDYEYGYSVWQDLTKALETQQIPYEIITTLWPRLFESNYTPFINALLDKPTDLIINSMWGGDLVAFIKQANSTKLFDHAKFANFDTGGNYEVLAVLGNELPDGLILSSRHHNNWPDTELNNWFVSRFKEISGRYPSYAAEGAYSGILAIAEALANTETYSSKEDIKKALETLVLHLPEDPIGFSSFMDGSTHQIQQVIAIGITTQNAEQPPAQKLLSNWSVYYPSHFQ
ncbi:ABC transporter substrate-binding protein [Marinomonas fungiae]|uniref:Amino acid/amide ABC transporter substrate-binding protein, HAAT family (TC 3.A.1.4.-) n=1 Tax=Marinomonas fungiae TaxID=1137284 RepID=A0A0K6IJB5_9GAMM|nr:ABC transporter substrate-binding protein [Marinomonas fungiae]CUB03183.1 amino acid/amide ABC transporter substrate-binding protein, HAAT family (TC 3.A.1.4.-) [Marinomonas fungiae]